MRSGVVLLRISATDGSESFLTISRFGAAVPGLVWSCLSVMPQALSFSLTKLLALWSFSGSG